MHVAVRKRSARNIVSCVGFGRVLPIAGLIFRNRVNIEPILLIFDCGNLPIGYGLVGMDANFYTAAGPNAALTLKFHRRPDWKLGTGCFHIYDSFAPGSRMGSYPVSNILASILEADIDYADLACDKLG